MTTGSLDDTDFKKRFEAFSEILLKKERDYEHLCGKFVV
jgi:hypothetical protein